MLLRFDGKGGKVGGAMTVRPHDLCLDINVVVNHIHRRDVNINQLRCHKTFDWNKTILNLINSTHLAK